jgi:hypothetical protein
LQWLIDWYSDFEKSRFFTSLILLWFFKWNIFNIHEVQTSLPNFTCMAHPTWAKPNLCFKHCICICIWWDFRGKRFMQHRRWATFSRRNPLLKIYLKKSPIVFL